MCVTALGEKLTQDENHLLPLLDSLVRTINHLHRLLQLRPSPTMLVKLDVEHQPLAAEQLEALDEVVRQARPVLLVLQHEPHPLDQLPRARARRLLGLAHVLAEPARAEVHRRPRHEAQHRRAGLHRAPHVRDLGQRVRPVLAAIVGAVRLDDHKAPEV
jgi:hypothetical protein